MIIEQFTGLNNTADPLKLKPGALTRADNVCVTKSGTLIKRPGRSKAYNATRITGSYGTSDNVHLFLVDNGVLQHWSPSGATALLTGLPSAPVFWCEESPSRVFLASQAAFVMIDNGIQVTDLAAAPPPDALGINDLSVNTETFPTTGVTALAYHQGSVWFAVRAADNLTDIRGSIPGAYTVYHQTLNRFELPDTVYDMRGVDGQLIIAAAHGIWVYTADQRLLKLLDYGVVPGRSIAKQPDNGCLIWTTRGVVGYNAQAGAKNLTEQTVSLPPGNGAATALFDYAGDQYLLICTDGDGLAYNAL